MKRGGPLQRYKPLRQTPLKRAGIHPRIVPTGPEAHTVDTVLERDCHSCAVCGRGITGQRGVDWSIHHRRARGMGGTTAPDTNLPSNLLTVCGNGTEGCHGLIESRRPEALDRGWLLRAGDVPSQRPVQHMLHGWVYLTDDGRISRAAPPVLRGDVIDLGGYNPGEVA